MSSLADRTVDELRVSRRQWKAAITRHLGSLKRAVAEDDVTAVKERLDKMKLSFNELEAVHIELTGRLTTDEDITESDNWYAVVEDAYIVGVTDAHTWLRSSQATNVSPNPVPGIVPVVASSAQPSSSDIRDDLVNLLSIPKVVIDKFEGDPLEYQAFIATFDELVHSKTSDNQIKLTRLLQYTAGPAKQAIKYCALVGGADGYSQARTILKDRFGDKHTLSQKIISDLKQGKSVSKAHEFQQVADDLRTGLTVLEKQGMVAEIDTQQNILDILGRFPSFVKGKWRKHALDFKRDNSIYPNFASFVKFVAQFAVDSCDPVYGTDIRKVQTARGKVHNNHSVTSPQPAGQLTARGVVQASPTSAGMSGGVAAHGRTQQTTFGHGVSKACIVCQQSHSLFQCGDFRGMTPRARLDLAKLHKLCFNCLRDNHRARECYRTSVCSVPGCGQKHTKFLHLDVTDNSNSTADTSVSTVPVRNSHVNSHGSNIHLPLVAVNVNDQCQVYALLDSGSTNTFVTRELATRLNLSGPKVKYQMSTLSESADLTVPVVSMCLSSMHATCPVSLNNVLVVPEIPARAPSVDIDVNNYPHLADIPVLELGENLQAEILIGMDNAHLLMPLEIKCNENVPNQPYAMRTYFGWTLCGTVDGLNPCNNVCSNFVSVDRQVENLWQMENCDDEYAMSCDDKKVIELWDRETVWEDGHYTIPIPWRQERPNFPDNKFVARRRLDSTVRKLERTGLMEKYDENMQTMLNDGYAEPVPECDLDLSDGSVWFLPHHPVISESRPGKVRIVHDCAAKLAGISLNNQCFQGPDLVNKLIHVLLRFRLHRLAIMADVQAMYMQVKVPPRDRNALRFLWIVDGLVKQYRMTSHLFGGVWCAASSTYALRRTIEDCPAEPSGLVKQAILRNFYVDDLLQSVRSAEEALEIIDGTKNVLNHGGFKLTKFVTNDVRLLRQIDEADRATEVREIFPEMMSKALGVKWEVCADTFQYVYKQQSQAGPVTRRLMLSYISSMFDPLGFISAITLRGKMLFQEATRLQLDWDTPVPDALAHSWMEWLQSLPELDTLKFNRCMIPGEFADGVAEVHNFCDGSQVGYGCCSYIRVINETGQIHVALITAKSRLAPLKRITVPRLELASAVLAVKMNNVIRRELDVPVVESTFWSDSEITLAYIRNESRRFKVFVANRVSFIREFSSPAQWRHIDGCINPADIVSRGCLVRDLPTTWSEGPEFLWTYKCDWPKSGPDSPVDGNDPEVICENTKSCNVCAISVDDKHPLQALCDHYSSFYKLKKAVVWLLRIRDHLLKRDKPRGPIRFPEMHAAETLLITFVQERVYGAEMASLKQDDHVARTSSLQKISPVVADGLLVVGGRLKHAPAALRLRNPIILPYRHRLSTLIVLECHGDTHLGTEWVLSKLRTRFWIVGARKLIKKIKRECVTCKRLYARPMSQKMADLPPERCLPGQPPFAYVGVDLFGPIYVKQGRADVKRYGCLSTCFNSRAVHIEKLDSLETDTFINGFVRFVARRGGRGRLVLFKKSVLAGMGWSEARVWRLWLPFWPDQ